MKISHVATLGRLFTSFLSTNELLRFFGVSNLQPRGGRIRGGSKKRAPSAAVLVLRKQGRASYGGAGQSWRFRLRMRLARSHMAA